MKSRSRPHGLNGCCHGIPAGGGQRLGNVPNAQADEIGLGVLGGKGLDAALDLRE